MRFQCAASVRLTLAAAVTAVAQAPRTGRGNASASRLTRVALSNVRIVDGTRAPAREDQTLIVENGRILLGHIGDDRSWPRRVVHLNTSTVWMRRKRRARHNAASQT